MLKYKTRVIIFTGNIGSGKTEIALNYALRKKEEGQQVTVVDLDIINPYFRTRTVRRSLEERGIGVVSPEGKLAGADVPALSPAILGVLQGRRGLGVFDVGGDDVGAVALGRFKSCLPEGDFTLFFVINTCRPFTRTVEGIAAVLRSVEEASRLKVDALVSNTNLGRATDAATFLEGHQLVKEASRRLNLPIAFAALHRGLLEEVGEIDVPVLPLDLFMKLPWDMDE